MTAELLYESEATLRMVDTVLDELQISDTESALPLQGMWALRSEADESGDPCAGYDVFVRGYWQVQELLECLAEVRRSFGARVAEHAETATGGRERLDHVLSLVDSLEAGRGMDRPDVASALRHEIRDLLESAGLPGDVDPRVASALAMIGEAEGRLTRLAHLFEVADR